MVSCETNENHFEKSWSSVNDRVWIGSEFWSNRLQDWKIQNGRLECIQNQTKLMMRTSHLINLRLAKQDGAFFMSVDQGPLQSSQNEDAASGFLIGAGPELDVWGASLIQQKIGSGAGLFGGVNAKGELFLKDMETGDILKSTPASSAEFTTLVLELIHENSSYTIKIILGDSVLSIPEISRERLIGNIALVSHPGSGKNPGSFWFNNLEVWGSKLETFEGRVGPIISTQYTLSDNTLKMTAQMVPVGKTDPTTVNLDIDNNGKWEEISTTEIITPGYTATFKIPDWDSSKDIPYRVKYIYQSSSSDNEIASWEGTIRHDPVEKEELVIAGFTGNHNVAHPGLSGAKGKFNFDPSGIWYPHKEVVEHVKAHQPDVLFFSGDQVYEGNSPTFADRQNYELDYLYKWYLYCLAYRDLSKDIPTISIPDDHDVYQGNVWGQGGRAINRDNKGGYVHPEWLVQLVERTQCRSLPYLFFLTPIAKHI